ncbi:flagella synthesis protein FlgN [Noviherbaspirillum aerium]|uniref:flagella synthesis protein FlgN n=1 Tax=Noviherbaspirillum aerium TaxID=2588497 RepID=UPI00124DC29D|nr:flagellar protein FlgN [Noviherbaspirillum aerium]
MHKPESHPGISLNEEIAAGAALLQLLKQEQEHLIQADLEGLTAVTEDKAKIVARMTELALARHRSLGTAGYSADESGMQAWVKSAPADAARAWGDLLNLARDAKELNRSNGLLIGQHMARNQDALSVLQGNQRGGTMYGPSGQTTSAGGNRTLVVG